MMNDRTALVDFSNQRILFRERAGVLPAIISMPRAPSHRFIIGEEPRKTNECSKPPYKDGEIAPVAVARKQGARAKVTLAPISG